MAGQRKSPSIQFLFFSHGDRSSATWTLFGSGNARWVLPVHAGFSGPGDPVVLPYRVPAGRRQFCSGPLAGGGVCQQLTAGITWDVYLSAAAFPVWLLNDAASASMSTVAAPRSLLLTWLICCLGQ
jgi:hypothetical protein